MTPEPSLPQQNGPYRLGTRLDAGPLGETFAAKDGAGGQWALTLIRPELAADANWRDRFDAAVARLRTTPSHPNVQAVGEFGEAEGRLFLAAQPFARTLRDEEAALADDLSRALQILADAARGLQHVHKAGIVHGALRPEAVLVDGTGAVFVATPGLAALARDESAAAVTYRSPEQCQGEQPSPASDLYALGVILYELLNGVAPFTGSAAAISRKHIEAATPTTLLPEIAGANRLEALLNACLAKAPGERTTAAAVAVALDAILAPSNPAPEPVPQPVVAGPASPPALPPPPPATRGLQVEVFDAAGARLALRELPGRGLSVGGSSGAEIVLPGLAPRAAQIGLFWKERRATIELLEGEAWLDGGALAADPAPWRPDSLVQLGAYWLRLIAPQAPAVQPTPVPTLSQPPRPVPTETPRQESVPSSSEPAVAPVPNEEVQQGNLLVTLERNTLVLTPGEPPVDLGLTVVNNSSGRRNAKLSFDIALTDLPEHKRIPLPKREPIPEATANLVKSWILEWPEVDVGPGKEQRIRLPIKVLANQASRAGTYGVRLLVRNKEGPGASVPMTWVVKPYMQTRAALEQDPVEGFFGAGYILKLKNDGNAAVAYTLRASDQQRKLSSSPLTDTTTLEPGKEGLLGISLFQPWRVRLLRDQPYNVNLILHQVYAHADEVGESGERIETIKGSFRHLTILPAWLATLLFVTALAILAWLLRPPSIDTLALEPTVGVVQTSVVLRVNLSDNAREAMVWIPPSTPITFTRNLSDSDMLVTIPYTTTLPRDIEVRAYNPLNPFMPATGKVTLPFITPTLPATPVPSPTRTSTPTLTPVPCATPFIRDLFAIPPDIEPGGTANLFWNVDNATKLYIDNDVGDVLPTPVATATSDLPPVQQTATARSVRGTPTPTGIPTAILGAIPVNPVERTTYELQASNCGVVVRDQVEVNVVAAEEPVVTELPTEPPPPPTQTPTTFGLISCPQFTRIRVEGGPRLGAPGTPYLIYFRERQVGGGSLDRRGSFRNEIEVLRERAGDYPVSVRLRDSSTQVPIRVFAVNGGADTPLPPGSEIVCRVPSPTPRMATTSTPRPTP